MLLLTTPTPARSAPTSSGLHRPVGPILHEHEAAPAKVGQVVGEVQQRRVVKGAIGHLRTRVRQSPVSTSGHVAVRPQDLWLRLHGLWPHPQGKQPMLPHPLGDWPHPCPLALSTCACQYSSCTVRAPVLLMREKKVGLVRCRADALMPKAWAMASWTLRRTSLQDNWGLPGWEGGGQWPGGLTQHNTRHTTAPRGQSWPSQR